ncbi:MAG TPA: hypothetical protein VF551_01885, partial [Chthoniobacterales bacterium]
ALTSPNASRLNAQMERGARTVEEELIALETGALDPADFPHREHVRLAFEMLGRYPFDEALTRFLRGLRFLTAKAGKPELLHVTITVAFLALIAERRATAHTLTWSDFIAANADLLDKHVLEQWYSPEQLQSELARTTFCLPEIRPASGPSAKAQDLA